MHRLLRRGLGVGVGVVGIVGVAKFGPSQLAPKRAFAMEAGNSKKIPPVIISYTCKSDKPPKKFLPCDCGEDAFFINQTSKVTTLGVADGVGGWSSVGVDSSLFAWALMNSANEAASKTDFSPKQILQEAHTKLLNMEKKIRGSSTACIISYDHEKKILSSANLGDSGFVIIRNGKIAFQSEETLHGFNAPYQLSSSVRETNFPEEAICSKFLMNGGDMVVLASDGLFDNVFEVDLCTYLDGAISQAKKFSQLNQLQELQNELDEAAKSLLQITNKKAHSKSPSPFSVKAGQRYVGGKPDDITIVMMFIPEDSKELPKAKL